MLSIRSPFVINSITYGLTKPASVSVYNLKNGDAICIAHEAGHAYSSGHLMPSLINISGCNYAKYQEGAIWTVDDCFTHSCVFISGCVDWMFVVDFSLSLPVGRTFFQSNDSGTIS